MTAILARRERRLARSYPRWCVLGAMLFGCAKQGAEIGAPRAGESPLGPASVAGPPPSLLSSPARLTLLTKAPMGFDAEELERTPVVRLEGDAVGYLDSAGSRTLATLAEVRRIPGPVPLTELCVADDGRTTFARSGAQYEEGKLWRAERFDAPLELVGDKASRLSSTSESRKSFIVRAENGMLLVECGSARVVRITGRARAINYLLWSRTLQVLRVTPEQSGPEYCAIRGADDQGFTDHTDCQLRKRKDGAYSIEKRPPEPPGFDKTAKPADKINKTPPVCLLVVDAAGHKRSCSEPEGPEEKWVPRPKAPEKASLKLARFYAKDLAVAPGSELGLFRLGPGTTLEPANRIGSEALGLCRPLLAIEPVFWCKGDPVFDVVVRVEPDGSLVQELRRQRPLSQYPGHRQDPRFHHTTDGGLAVGGDCQGNLNDAACVRTRHGRWQTVAFSKELVTALGRTAPATRLIPTPDGGLYVGTGTMDQGSVTDFNSLSRALAELQILVFRADRGGAAVIQKLPIWILKALSGLKDAPDSSYTNAVNLSFAGPERVRAWPLEREHPAFGTTEHCRVDITLEGSFETACMQGRLFATGQFGLLQKELSEIYETLDAGGTWTRVSLPKGLETDTIDCSPLGCRVGPYFRQGWGEPAR